METDELTELREKLANALMETGIMSADMARAAIWGAGTFARAARDIEDAATISGRTFEEITGECCRQSAETGITFERAAAEAVRLATVSVGLEQDEQVRRIKANPCLSTAEKRWYICQIQKERMRNG